jgi:hypothetical protein
MRPALRAITYGPGLAGLLVLAIAGGCAPARPVRIDGQAATLEFTRGATQLGAKSLQVFAAYDDASCTRKPGYGPLASLLTYMRQSRSVDVAGGRPLYLMGATLAYRSVYGTDQGRPAVGVGRDECIRVARFTPQVGERYAVTQQGDAFHCELVVVLVATGQPVSDRVDIDPVDCPARDF